MAPPQKKLKVESRTLSLALYGAVGGGKSVCE
jgi:hypothetical protein